MNRALWGLVAAGTALKLVLAFATFGNRQDIGSAAAIAHGLIDGDPFDVYSDLPTLPVPMYPYPPGSFPVVLLAGALARLLPGHFDDWIHLCPVLADAGLALAVHRILGHRGFDERVRLGAAALVAFGPIFVAISGIAYQIDSVAVLPALIGVVVWDARRTANRALVAGLLVGLAASVKLPLGLVVLAMLPTARGVREAGLLSVYAVSIPVAVLTPFLISDASGTLAQLLGHEGVAGHAMLTAVVNPGATEVWITHDWRTYAHSLQPLAPLLLAGIAALVIAVGFRYRPPAVPLAVVLWLAVWAFGSGFFFHYLIWGLPFLLVAGRLREAAALQVFGGVALIVLDFAPHPPDVLLAYRVWIYALFAFTVWLLVRSVRGLSSA